MESGQLLKISPPTVEAHKELLPCSAPDRNGDLVSVVQVFEGDEMMLISDQGTLVRTRTEEVSVLGRTPRGALDLAGG